MKRIGVVEMPHDLYSEVTSHIICYCNQGERQSSFLWCSYLWTLVSVVD